MVTDERIGREVFNVKVVRGILFFGSLYDTVEAWWIHKSKGVKDEDMKVAMESLHEQDTRLEY